MYWGRDMEELKSIIEKEVERLNGIKADADTLDLSQGVIADYKMYLTGKITAYVEMYNIVLNRIEKS